MNEVKVDHAAQRLARRQKWVRIVGEFETSGLTGAAFCRERGLCPWQLSYWKNVLRRAEPASPGFVELHMAPPPDGIWVECGRWRVAVAGDFDASVLRRTVEALS